MTQDSIFLESEGDAWFRRNSPVLLGDEGAWAAHDMPLRLLGLAGVTLDSALEFGCAAGTRLDLLLQRGIARTAAGTDASAQAIATGRARYPALDLRQARIADGVDERFDLVIVNFVLHWVDRGALAASLAAIDRAVRPGGWLLVGDFLPDAPRVRDYSHCPGVFTYKQDYAAAFAALGWYRTAARLVYDHDDPAHPLDCEDENRRAFCSLLRKSATAP